MRRPPRMRRTPRMQRTPATRPWPTPGGDNGSASTIARGDHLHDGRYYTQTSLQTSGEAQVHWGNITSKPTLTCSTVATSVNVGPGSSSGIVEVCCNPGTVMTGG